MGGGFGQSEDSEQRQIGADEVFFHRDSSGQRDSLAPPGAAGCQGSPTQFIGLPIRLAHALWNDDSAILDPAALPIGLNHGGSYDRLGKLNAFRNQEI
jgi:hypothetical protein